MSLAGAQCLIFALLLLRPRQEGNIFLPDETRVQRYAFIEALLLSSAQLALGLHGSLPVVWTLFSGVQALLIAVPLLRIPTIKVSLSKRLECRDLC